MKIPEAASPSSGAGRHPDRRAGMTEQRVVIDAQIIAARLFSKEVTKVWKIISLNFVLFVPSW